MRSIFLVLLLVSIFLMVSCNSNRYEDNSNYGIGISGYRAEHQGAVKNTENKQNQVDSVQIRIIL